MSSFSAESPDIQRQITSEINGLGTFSKFERSFCIAERDKPQQMMGFMGPLLDFQTVGWPDAMARVALAMAFGFCLGLDRDIKNKPVDFRVYMIVAATTCLLAIMGQEFVHYYKEAYPDTKMDLLRIVEGVLTGIGFLGAGAILKSSNGSEHRIIGTATGASIWSSGAIGLMLGFGLYGLALLAFAVLVIILVVFGILRKPLFNQSDKY